MSRLQDALLKQKQQTEQHNQALPGLLGIPLNGQRAVEVPTRNSYVYVRLRSNQSEVIQAFNNQVAPAYNLPVLVERQGNRYVVISIDTQRYENNWSSFAPFLPRHGNTHSFDTESGGGGDIVWVYPRQFTPTLVMPSGSSGAGNVIVMPYTLMNPDGTWKYTGNTGTDSFLPYRPTSATGAVMGLVYLDVVDGNPKITINSGTVFSNSITGSSRISQYIPQVLDPSSHIPLAAIRLITGTSAISWDNIYDIRQEFRPVAKRFSTNMYFLTSGSASVAGYDLMTLAVPTGTYNFYSASISATGTLLGDWITEPNVPNTSFISDGIYHLHIHATKTAGTKDANIKFYFFKRTSGGVETQILASELSDNIPTSELEIDLESVASEQSLSSTDRLGIRIYGYQVGVGSAPTVQLKIEGDTFSRFEIPAISTTSTGGGGIGEAPINGNVYGRLNAAWTNIDSRYLKLDASNGPITNTLIITEYNAEGLHVDQFATANLDKSAVSLVRDGDHLISKPGILLIDYMNTNLYSAGLLEHYISGSVLKASINAYAPVSGTVLLIDSVNNINSAGRLLSLKNVGVEKFAVDGLGNPNITSTSGTYNVNGVPHTHAGGSGGDWVLIEDKYLDTGDATNFDFQNISTGTYKHLEIELHARSDRATLSDAVLIKFNNDGGSNYIGRIQWAGSSNVEQAANTPPPITYIAAANAPANYYSTSFIKIFNYANGHVFPGVQGRGGDIENSTVGNFYIYDATYDYLSATPISRITLSPGNGTHFKQYSRATLYGMK